MCDDIYVIVITEYNYKELNVGINVELIQRIKKSTKTFRK